MARKTCSRCGLPKGIGRGNIWHANGVVTASVPPHIRGTLYDVEELNSLFPALSERIGFDITRLVIEGKRKDGRRYADSLIRNLATTGHEPSPLEVYNLVARFCKYWGLGLAEVLDYREGERLTMRISGYYNDPMSRGDWAGVFEAAEKRRGEPVWKDEPTRETLDIVATEGEPELEQRIEQEVELGIPCEDERDLQYEQCPECGVPLEVPRQFSWNADEALILEKISGKRFILHNTNGIAAVLRVLREELGEEIDRMVMDISRDYARGYYRSLKGESSLDAELMKFPLRSWGRPTKLARKGDHFRIAVVNPYAPSIVAGRMWGLLETFSGRELALGELVQRESYLEMILSSKND
ncbi:MAG: hypothetical protein H5T73_09140 [Actinobacteria bacterium]|nr:hypothetical protein [Actinomycetota bacterium]